jgi:serine/threonine-protein kinase HipA
MHVAEEDYLSVLAGLGNECLGAVRICEPGAGGCSPSYKKISREELLEFAKEGASKSAQFLAKAHLSLTGASGKTGLYYDNKDGWYMPFGTAPSTHIVKQSHVRLSGIVANEQLCLRTAKILGIDVPESFIISVGTGEHILFATKRFDRLMQEDSRVIDGKKVPFRLQQEDFCVLHPNS